MKIYTLTILVIFAIIVIDFITLKIFDFTAVFNGEEHGVFEGFFYMFNILSYIVVPTLLVFALVEWVKEKR